MVHCCRFLLTPSQTPLLVFDMPLRRNYDVYFTYLSNVLFSRQQRTNKKVLEMF